MLFLEILLSIHCLVFLSSWVIEGSWLAHNPSLKLKLARFLLISCVLSPFMVHCLNTNTKPEWHHYASIDALQDYVNQPILQAQTITETPKADTTFSISDTSYVQLFYLLFCLLIIFRTYRVILSLSDLRMLLSEAISYRTSGKLRIKVSQRCHIPFSVMVLNKAYIILPISIFSSPKNVQIAIAHEGQHHRNGDCWWAYFIEALRIILWGNPGVTRWSRILSDLQEFSCDEVLVGQPKISAHDYGHCLFDVIQTVSQCSLPSNREIACTVGMALNKDNEDSTLIIRRITMLSAYPMKQSKSLVLGLSFVGLSILAPITVAYSALGSLTSSKAKEIDTSHLNPQIQGIAEQEIKNAVKQYHAKSGVIAMVDTKTGQVIAFAESNNNRNSWKSRVFSPGSTIKPFIAATAIDAGLSSETKRYTCNSPYSVEGTSFSDYYVNKGPTSLTQAMAKSSNVCLIKVAQETGASRIRKKLTEFGLDMDTMWQANQSDDLQLAKLVMGNVPVTIDSLSKSYALLANQGRPFKGGAPVISATTSQSITHILENVVNKGTGKQALIPGINVAGKTGTTATLGENLALFAGYLPANAPRYAIVVVIENGQLRQNGKTLIAGGELAAPIFRKLAMSSLNSPKL